MSAPQVALTCQQCQRRKTKCDKKNPCSSCTAADIHCQPVKRNRMPRGRSGNKASARSALRERVGRLESSLSRAQEQDLSNALQNSSIPGVGSSVKIGWLDDSQTPMDRFVAADFWEELAETVSGLRDVLESPLDAEDQEETLVTTRNNPSPANDSRTSSHSLFFGTASSPAIPYDHRHTPQRVKSQLLSTYRDRVDVLFKAVHWPTVVTSINVLEHSGYDKHSNTATSVLEAALYFTAVCSLRDAEIEDRQVLVQRFRAIAERSFTRSSLLTTSDIVVLQAFVIYLAGLRASQANAQQWTLLATAIRIASAQNIPARSEFVQSALIQQTQRRVWHCIGLLDMQSAFDRGTQPMLRSSEFQLPPLSINDVDLYPESKVENFQSREESFTEMTFSRLVNQAMLCQMRLTEIGVNAASALDGYAITAGHEQMGILASFESYVNELNTLCGRSPSLLQQYCMSVASESLVAMQLLLHRPFYKRQDTFLSSELLASGIDILEMATAVLERSQHKRSLEAYQQWAWFSWIKWYALAVVLVELCSRPNLDRHTERAWDAANHSYQDYAQVVADTRTGLLWKPIAKLMRRASTFRANVISRKQTPPNGQSDAQNILHYATSRQLDSLFTENAGTPVLVAPAASHSESWSAEVDTWATQGYVDISQQQWEALIDEIYKGSDFMDPQGLWSGN